MRSTSSAACAFRFLFAFLVDGWHGVSLTRLMAIYVVHGTMVIAAEAKRVSGNDVIVVIACLSAAFGKGIYEKFLLRWMGASRSTDTTITETVRITQEEITARRAPDGTEPAGRVPQVHND